MLEHFAVVACLALVVLQFVVLRWAPRHTGVRNLVASVLSVAVGAAIITEALARPYVIPTGSMRPTIREGDRVLADLLETRVHAPQRGDVVIITSPEGIRLCKRVIGLGGDTLAIHAGTLFVNGVAAPEAYVPEPMADDMSPFTIPGGQLFVMGDNRNNSRDSRSYGTLPVSAVQGKVTTIWWPPSHFRRL